MPEARFDVPGYLVVIDADGVELEETRRIITGMPRDLAYKIEEELKAGLGDGCYVVFREPGTCGSSRPKLGRSAQ